MVAVLFDAMYVTVAGTTAPVAVRKNTVLELIVVAFMASLNVTTGAMVVATEAPLGGLNDVTVGAVVSAGAAVVNGDVAVLTIALPAASRTPLAPPCTTIK
jgi:hypothetical protein